MAKHAAHISIVSWIALGVALCSLLLSGITYMRVTQQDPALIAHDLQSQMTAFKQQSAVNHALTQLEDIRAQLKEGTEPIETQNDVTDIKRELTLAYKGSEQKTNSSWQIVDTELTSLLNALKLSPTDAMKAVDHMIETIRLRLL